MENHSCEIQLGKQTLTQEWEDLSELSLAHAVTIQKLHGREFDALIIPVDALYVKMLSRNSIHTSFTRAKHLCVFSGSRKALSMSVKQIDNRKRQTALGHLAMH
ncbi:MAG TPA: ATP-binding domain-containing protein [Nitrospirota bacterium]|nr:ATP-binding domain-containing protein [Nitrospirota bacterium]